MPTPTKGPRLGGSPAHQRLILANLATQLFEHGRITTTVTKAQRVKPLAEKLITQAKRGDLHSRRLVLGTIRDKDVVHRLFSEIAPSYANRPGGYTRIIKAGNRKGDNAPIAIIELVEALTVAQSAVGEAERARGTRFAKDAAPAPAAAATGAAAAAAPAAAATGAAAAAVPAEETTSAVEATGDATEAPDTAAEGSDVPTEVPAADEVAPAAKGELGTETVEAAPPAEALQEDEKA